MSFLGRILRMAAYGAVGASVGGAMGELLFRGEASLTVPSKSVCMLFDVSGSMEDETPEGRTQMEHLQAAATDFVARQDCQQDEFALVSFASRAEELSGKGSDAAQLREAIAELHPGGATDLARGLRRAADTLGEGHGERWVLLFSDGRPQVRHNDVDAVQQAITAAAEVRARGVEIVAIGTGLADRTILESVTGDPELVFLSEFDALPEAFRSSEEVIMNRQMLAVQGDSADFRTTVKRAGLWASLLAVGIGLALVSAQNRYLHRRALGSGEIAVVVLGGVVTGVVAGGASQSLFYYLSAYPTVLSVARVAAWVLLGFGAGYGLGHVVPNLLRSRAALGGTLGGITAGAAFLTWVPQMGDSGGRLLAAAILGAATGMMLVVVEAVSRKAWVEVDWGKGERSILNLGATPIVVGRSGKAHICPSHGDDVPEVIARLTHRDGQVRYEEGASGKERVLRGGETLRFGAVSVHVHESSEAAGEPSAPLPRAADRPRAKALTPDAPVKRP